MRSISRAVSGLGLALVFLLGMYSPAFAAGIADSLQLHLLPNRVQGQVVSVAAPTLAGKHPSAYHFAIADAGQQEVAAWLAGDYDQLEGQFTTDSTRNSKADFFERAQEMLGQARAAIDELERIGNFISQFDGRSLVSLPVGLKKVMDDGTQFTVVINRITLYPTHAELTVFAKVKTADMATPLFLGSPDIKFTRRGGISLGSLGLLGNFDIPIMERKGFLRFKPAVISNNDFVVGQGTFVSLDCDGLQSFNLDVDLAFSREVVVPVRDSAGVILQLPPQTLVQAQLELGASNGINNILASVNFTTPFVQPEKPDIVWTIGNVVFDFSETRNHESLLFPIAGHTPDLPPEMMPTWKGVYIQNFGVRLPNGLFSGGGDATPQTIAGEDIVIDSYGFSGYVSVAPLLSLVEGNADGWAYSIDSLEVAFYRNTLVGIEFSGLVNVPLFNEGDEGVAEDSASINYYALYDKLNQTYGFSIASAEARQYKSKMLQATISLLPGSRLDMVYSEVQGFEISATLFGNITIDTRVGGNGGSGTGNAASSGTPLQLPTIAFHGLVIGNKAPYVHQVGTWDTPTLSVNLGGFALSVSDIDMVADANQPGDVALRFMGGLALGTSSTAITADGAFRLMGQIETLPSGKQNWKFRRLKVDALFVNVNNDKVAFEGYIIFFEDNPSFGSGFQGKMSLEVKKLSSTKIEALALFGATDGYRYFFVDVMARFGAGIPMGGLSIKALGGGVYVNMRQATTENDFSTTTTESVLPNYTADASDTDGQSPYELALQQYLGRSLSGILYEPDPGVRLGINFSVVLSTAPDEEKFNLNATLNFEFNDQGGINQIRLYGFANVMAPISWSGPSCSGVSTQFDMLYMSGANTESGKGYFMAMAQVFVNTNSLKGGNVIPVSNSDTTSTQNGPSCEALYNAGGLNMFFSSDNWYVWIGVPEYPQRYNEFPHTPLNLILSRGDSTSNAAAGADLTIKGYFNIGTQLPPFPGLPSRVEALTGLGNLVQAESTRASGRGFAFGLNISAESSVKALGIVEARLALDIGFDIMLQRYNDATCINNNNQPLGINGWYAAGQAWAYVEGEVSVLGFNVLNAALAAAIQIKGPNPTYGRGAIAGRYSVLGGLKKGSFRFPLEFGKQCELAGGEALVLDRDIIGGIIPLDGAQGVLVQEKPTIDFNYPVGKIVSEPNGEESTYYSVELTEFRVLKGDVPVAGTYTLREDGYSATFHPEEVFHGGTNYTIMATAALYEVNEAGVRISGSGPMDTDVETIMFTTGESPGFIPYNNVAHAWPADGQFNFYQGETVSHYIQLASGQDSLLSHTPTNHSPILRLTTGSSAAPIDVPFTYDATANRVNFQLPALTPNTAYKAELMYRRQQGQQQVQGATVATRPAGDKILLTYYFRVSAYPTVAAKMNAAQFGQIAQQAPTWRYQSIVSNLQEPFGMEEIVGLDWMPQPTFSFEADLESTDWMRQFFTLPVSTAGFSNLYDTNLGGCGLSVADLDYNIPGLVENRQDLGLIPRKAVKIFQPNLTDYQVTEENYTSVGVNTNSFPAASIDYAPFAIVSRDLSELRSRVRAIFAERIVFKRKEVAEDECTFQSSEPNPYNSSSCCGTEDYREALYYAVNNDIYYQNACFRSFFIMDPTTYQYESYWGQCPDPFKFRTISTSLLSTSSYPVQIKHTLPQGTETTRLIHLHYGQL